MKKDIEFPKVENVCLAVVQQEEGEMWEIYLINNNEKSLNTVLVTSKGYGDEKGEKKQTSVLRHAFPEIKSGMHIFVEPIDPKLFHLTNEYWVSYFIEDQLYDKKFLFVPGSMHSENSTFIKQLNRKGILHM